MSARHKNGIKKYAAAVFFLVLMLGLNVNASAATWKLNANGTYSCYENGKLVRNKWITQGGNRYYVNSSGIRQTGWLFSGGKWYFFIKSSGALLKNSWLTSEKKIYCAGSDGAMYAGGMRRINNKSGSYYYAFSARGIRLTGMRTYGGKTYFLRRRQMECVRIRAARDVWLLLSGVPGKAISITSLQMVQRQRTRGWDCIM